MGFWSYDCISEILVLWLHRNGLPGFWTRPGFQVSGSVLLLHILFSEGSWHTAGILFPLPWFLRSCQYIPSRSPDWYIRLSDVWCYVSQHGIQDLSQILCQIRQPSSVCRTVGSAQVLQVCGSSWIWKGLLHPLLLWLRSSEYGFLWIPVRRDNHGMLLSMLPGF